MSVSPVTQTLFSVKKGINWRSICRFMEAVSVSLASHSVDSISDTVKLWKLLTPLHLKWEKPSLTTVSKKHHSCHKSEKRKQESRVQMEKIFRLTMRCLKSGSHLQLRKNKARKAFFSANIHRNIINSREKSFDTVEKSTTVIPQYR